MSDVIKTTSSDSMVVTLREYIDLRIQELDRRLLDRFVLNDIAVGKAERTMNERLNSMNEFREALREQSNKMATRIELEKTDANVQDLRRAKAELDGKLFIFAGGISFIISIITAIIIKYIR